MDDETQKRPIAALSSAIVYGPTSRLADRFVREPEARGLSGGFEEALLRAGFSPVSTLVASYRICRVVGSPLGS